MCLQFEVTQGTGNTLCNSDAPGFCPSMGLVGMVSTTKYSSPFSKVLETFPSAMVKRLERVVGARRLENSSKVRNNQG